MKTKNWFKGLVVLVVVSFAYSADSTAKSVTPPPTTVISSNKSEATSSGLKKQLTIMRPTTTWSKIKDLFM